MHQTTRSARGTRRTPTSDARRGFTLVEILVAMAILVTISAVSAPVLLSYLQKQRVERTRDMLEAMANGVAAFKKDTQHNPGNLTHLSELIATSQSNSCGNPYPAGAVNNWAGPYINRILPAGGAMTPIGRLRNELVRTGQVGAAFGTLTMTVEQVQQQDAELLNALIDGDLNAAGGAVRWSAADANGFVGVSYVIPISGC